MNRMVGVVNADTTGESSTGGSSTGWKYQLMTPANAPAKTGLLLAQYDDGPWGTICGLGFNDYSALLACRTLGYGNIPYAKFVPRYPGGSNYTIEGGIYCPYGAQVLQSCFVFNASQCDHTEDVGLDCRMETTTFQFGLVPENPQTPWRGRLEIKPSYASTFGTVCTDGFDDVAALAACHSLGYTNITMAYAIGWYGGGTGTIYVDDTSCVASDYYFQNCSFKQSSIYFSNHNCQHWEDVGVDCSGQPRPADPIIAYTAVVDDDDASDFVQIMSDYLFLNFTAGNRIQIISGPVSNGTAGFQVITFRFTDAAWPTRSALDYDIIISSPLELFTYAGIYSLTSNASASVAPNLQFRLTGGTNSFGVLEVRDPTSPDNGWGTVCNDGFGTQAAVAACHSLGFKNNNGVLVTGSGLSSAANYIRVSETVCTAADYYFQNCSFVWSTATNVLTNCRHSSDVVLNCAPNVPPPTPHFTLVTPQGQPNNTGLLLGRTEATQPWGTICGLGFNDFDALLACRALGYKGLPYAKYIPRYPGGENYTIAGGIYCSYTDVVLQQCSLYDVTGMCDHSEDVGIDCRMETTTFQFGLAIDNPQTPWRGRLEIKPSYASTFGTVCTDGFDDVAALAACHSLGFNVTQAYAIGWYGGGTGTIYVDDTSCVPSDYYFQNCSFKQSSIYSTNHNCQHWEDVGIDCSGQPRPVDAVIVYTAVIQAAYATGFAQSLSDYLWLNSSLGMRVKVLSGPVSNGTAGYDIVSFTFLDRLVTGPRQESRSDLDYAFLNSPPSDLLYYCGIVYWTSNSSDAVRANLQFRLVGGTSSSNGLLEVRSGAADDWGTVCDDTFDTQAALAACHSLGFNTTSVSVRASASQSNSGLFVKVNNVNCPASAYYFQNCSFIWSTPTNQLSGCTHMNDVVLNCAAPFVPPTPPPNSTTAPAGNTTAAPRQSTASPNGTAVTTRSPGATAAPGGTLAPGATAAPGGTLAPGATSGPMTTANPTVTQTQTQTATPTPTMVVFTATVTPTFNTNSFIQALAARTGANAADISVSVSNGVVTFSFTGGDVTAYNAAARGIVASSTEQSALGVTGMAASNVAVTSPPTSAGPNLGLIIGASVGGLVALIVIVAIIVKVAGGKPKYDPEYVAMQEGMQINQANGV